MGEEQDRAHNLFYKVNGLTASPQRLLVTIPGPQVIKLFSSSVKRSMKFQLLINFQIVKISGKFRLKTQKLVIYPAHER